MPKFWRYIAILAITLLFSSCAPARQILPAGEVPEAQNVSAEDEQYGHQVLSALSENFELSRDDALISRVREIANRLTEAAASNQIPWHIYVFQDDSFKNAAATRGNYVFVWSGMLNTVQDDDELATILAHEISHVLAGHTNRDPAEETRRLMVGVAGNVTGQIVSATGNAGIIANLAESLIKLSLQALIVNPDLQLKEHEADQVGLFLMADAGFDPEKGVNFWERVKADPDFSGFPLQFLSSHPSTEERYAKLRELLPLALERYNNRVNPSQAAKYKKFPIRQQKSEGWTVN